MKLHLVGIFRFSLVTPILATLTVLFLRGRDPSFLNFHKHSPAEIALSRVIKQVNFQRVPFNQAIDTLGRAAGVKIECDDEISSAGPYYHNVSLMAEQITLDDALRELLVSASVDRLYCFPDGDRIRIGDEESSQQPIYVDEYVVPDFISENVSQGRQVSIFSSSGPIFPLPRLYDYQYLDALDVLPLSMARLGTSNHVGVVWPPHVLVLLPEPSHRELHDVLEALRPQATANARRKLPFGTDVLDYVDGTFRARDSRAANDALRCVLPVITVPSQRLNKALELVASRVGVRIALADDLADVVFADVGLDAREITLASALRNLIGQSMSQPVDLEPDRDTIWICPQLKPKMFRVYDLRRCLANRSETEAADLLGRVRNAVPRRGGFEEYYENAGFLGSVFVVGGSWDELEVYEKSILKCLNAGSGPNATATPP